LPTFPKNKIVFQIPMGVSVEEWSFLELHKVENLENEKKEIEAVIAQQDTDEMLRKLLNKGASLKQLNPIHPTKKVFIDQDK